MTGEPGEDSCLLCVHEHRPGDRCRALIGVGFYSDDGESDEDVCLCLGYSSERFAEVTPDPWQEPEPPGGWPPPPF